MIQKHSFFLLFALLITIHPIFGQQIINVPNDFQTIQQALNSANEGATINVEPGTYVENINWPQTPGIVLQSTQGRELTIIDGDAITTVISIQDSNFENTIDSETIIDGFTIRNGVAISGGGINIYRGSPTLKNLIIEDNTANGQWAYGGGIYGGDVIDMLIQNCIIRNNLSVSDSWAYGAGINISGESIKIDNCTFENNEARGGGWSYGAGLYVRGDFIEESDVLVSRCTFIRNFSSDVRPYGSGFYSTDVTNLKLENCVFTRNRTDRKSVV